MFKGKIGENKEKTKQKYVKILITSALHKGRVSKQAARTDAAAIVVFFNG